MKEVQTRDLASLKLRAGVPGDLVTCYSAVVGDYVVEGHVPPEAVEKTLREQPNILSIAVPATPGVESELFQVIALDKNGKQSVYMSFQAGEG